MSHEAQCRLCVFARWRGHNVTACLRLDGDPTLSTDATVAINSILYTLARSHPCGARVALRYGPDAYWAEDLPEKEP